MVIVLQRLINYKKEKHRFGAFLFLINARVLRDRLRLQEGK